MTLAAAADDCVSMEQQQQQSEYQRRMSAPASYAVVPTDARKLMDASAVAPRRSSLVDAHDYSNPSPTPPTPPTPPPSTNANTNTNEVSSSRRSSTVDAPSNDMDEPTEPSTEPSRKRTERRHGCETMFSLDTIFSRDLRITGVSKKGASWRYHIEVLDIRNSLMPFTGSFTSTTSRTSTAASSPESLTSLPSSSAFTLPPLVRYSVMRRYNDFRQLYIYLVEYYGPELLDTLPKFPDGGLFSYFRGDDPKLLQFRKDQLQRFLRALDEHDDTKWSRAFRVFLNPEIDELTGIGGETFAAMVESYGRSSSSITTSKGLATDEGSTTATAPPLSSSASASYWESVGLSRINTSSGYVSLSHVKSPEIRFKKQPVDVRGDWKRRKIAHANRHEGGEGMDDQDGREAKKSRRVKRLDMDEPPQQEHPSDTGDEEEEDDDEDDAPKSSSIELMRLLSLTPMTETNQ